MRKHPHLFETHALIFLNRLRKKYRKPLTLLQIPAKEWEALAAQGFDIVWLMGAWRRSPASRDKAAAEPGLRQAYDKVMPGWKPQDVAGSPYAIYEYALDPALGAEGDLAKLRRTLNRAGLKLCLDFVPNHFAMDHPWMATHPEYFLTVPRETAEKDSGTFFQAHGRYFAHGKDPHFAAWQDTVQVNFFSADFRKAALNELQRIAGLADGVRCDMAMLALNRIFAETWKPALANIHPPAGEFWPDIIRSVKQRNPDFFFMAEVYWNMEWELQQQGFDFTYDKTLYDRLLHAPAPDVRSHLLAESAYQDKCARFIENHDERRAADAFGLEKSLAAAAVTSTLPGLRFFHDGQLEGRRLHIPIQLAAEAGEPADKDAAAFYKKLLDFAADETLHTGRWQLLSAQPAWQGSNTHANILTWVWDSERGRRLIVINYSAARSQARIRLPVQWLESRLIVLEDHAAGKRYERNEDELKPTGLYIDLAPWQSHLFELRGRKR